MTYKEPLEVLEAVLEKAAQDVSAGQWVTVNGRHMMIPSDQFHPQHGWVKVSHGTIPDSTMGRQGPGVYHGKGKKGGMADLHEHLRANGFSFDHAEGEMNRYGSPTDKLGNTLVYKHPDGREARMVNTQPADQTWDKEPPQYNPHTGFT